MIAALFVRRNSHYKDIPGVDCYDADRDALTFKGGFPGIYHPPCRAWGKYAHWAKPRAGERELAIWSMDMCRKFGGVIEHPSTSKLWTESNCLSYGVRDDHGGVLIPVYQSWWGHRAQKATCFYIVGPLPHIPENPEIRPTKTIEGMGRAEREKTPFELALWLVNVARDCGVSP